MRNFDMMKRFLFALVLNALAILPAFAAVAIVNTNTLANTSCSSGASVTGATQTVTAGATLLLFAAEADTATPGTVTAKWDVAGANQTMTLLGTVITQTGGAAPVTVALFGLISPTAGTNKIITMTWSGQATGANCYYQSMAFSGTTGVLATAAVGYGSASGTTSVSGGASVAATASAATGDIPYAFFSDAGAGFTGAVSSSGCGSGTQRGLDQNLTTNAESATCPGNGSTPTLTGTQTASNQWAAVIAIASAGGGGGGGATPNLRSLMGVGK